MKRQKLQMVKYRSICEITVKKVLDKRGESIAEVLIALLISALALTILSSMITSTKYVLETSKRKMNDYNSHAAVLAEQFDRIWKPAEIFLFFLVGASVSPQSALQAGPAVILLLAGSLLFRTAGVYISLLGAPFSGKEKFFCMLAYTPKATVQAAIGGIPFAMGLACGQTVLTVSAAAILLTAPLGAFGIDMTYKKFLHKQEQS